MCMTMYIYVRGSLYVNNNHQEKEAYLESSRTFKIEIFTRIINGWKYLPIAIKSSTLDIGRVRGSTAGREWNTVLDQKLKFIMLSMTYLKR